MKMGEHASNGFRREAFEEPARDGVHENVRMIGNDFFGLFGYVKCEVALIVFGKDVEAAEDVEVAFDGVALAVVNAGRLCVAFVFAPHARFLGIKADADGRFGGFGGERAAVPFCQVNGEVVTAMADLLEEFKLVLVAAHFG